ncbi:MAG TPA: M48 family metallopeptidase [Hyphomonadaceae bacterium]|nr:M48 family metallopeptidase [Hyphomonadaceae bacterium]
MCENHNVAAPRIVSLDGMHRRDVVRRLWAGTMLLGVAGTTGACETASEFFTPADSDLIPMAAEAWKETKQQTPISKDVKANQRLQTVGSKIASVANVPGAQWEFVVFDSKEKNAFCLPGGKVGFYKGLLDFVDNDDQIAAVLGHEVGHVVLRHAARRIGQETLTSVAIQGAGALVGSQVQMSSESLNMVMAAAGAGAQVGILLPFSRSNETEADRVGVDYMKQVGYDVKQAVRLWEKMGAASTDRPQEWMSTHPNPESRVADLKRYITEKGYATF